jgi:hypothetical protein
MVALTGLVMFGLGASPGSSDILRFRDMKPSYRRADKIVFVIDSRTDTSIRFYCAVETCIDGQWREIVLSIADDPRSKSVRFILIAPGRSRRMTWEPSEKYSFIRSGEHRFRLEAYAGSSWQTHHVVYSPIFRVQSQR